MSTDLSTQIGLHVEIGGVYKGGVKMQLKVQTKGIFVIIQTMCEIVNNSTSRVKYGVELHRRVSSEKRKGSATMANRDKEWDFHLRSISSNARDSIDPASDPSLLHSVSISFFI